MKKKAFIGLTILVIVTLALAYKTTSRPDRPFTQPVNDLPGVSMEAVEGSASRRSVTIRMVNDTDKRLTYGFYYDLQQLVGGTWYSMSDIIDNAAFPAMELFLEPGCVVEENFDWSRTSGLMSSGTYRIVKDFYKDGDYTKAYWLAAEFTVQS